MVDRRRVEGRRETGDNEPNNDDVVRPLSVQCGKNKAKKEAKYGEDGGYWNGCTRDCTPSLSLTIIDDLEEQKGIKVANIIPSTKAIEIEQTRKGSKRRRRRERSESPKWMNIAGEMSGNEVKETKGERKEEDGEGQYDLFSVK